MALFKTKSKQPITYTDNIASLIQRRRLQILVHSRLYYDLDTNMVSDDTWNKWAQELVELQANYPDIADKVVYHKDFRGFDGCSGFYLPRNNEQINSICNRLINYRENKLKREN